jgi:hypothetical protein
VLRPHNARFATCMSGEPWPGPPQGPVGASVARSAVSLDYRDPTVGAQRGRRRDGCEAVAVRPYTVGPPAAELGRHRCTEPARMAGALPSALCHTAREAARRDYRRSLSLFTAAHTPRPNTVRYRRGHCTPQSLAVLIR